MPAFVVTGSPGSGKPALARELAGRGMPAIGPAGRKEIREGRTAFKTNMLRAGAAALDSTAPAAVVADELLAPEAGRRAGLLRCEPLAGAGSTVP